MRVPCLLSIKQDFEYQIRNQFSELLHKERVPVEPTLIVFSQTWGSTALGFGGIGGQAMTSAYTTVIWDDYYNVWAVYFGERMAYIIKDPNNLFKENAFMSRNMESVSGRGKYVREDANGTKTN